MTELGRRLKELREQRGLTQRGLARESGLEHNTLSRIEQGHYQPSADTIRKLADGLDVPPGALFEAPKAFAR